jgi:hypothetical protein
MNMETKTKDFADLVPGDLVILRPHYGLPSVEKVDRVTANHFIVRGAKFRKRNGFSTGEGYTRPHVSIPREGDIENVREKVRRARLVQRFQHGTKWDQLPTNTLAAIAAYLDEEPEAQ